MKTSRLLGLLDQSLPEIEKLGQLRAPTEACGLLLDTPVLRAGQVTHVIELPNRSLEPSSYEVLASDIRLAMEGIEDVEDAAVWHTHPSGHIGPSRLDMQNRPTQTIPMLVVALTPDGPIATWF
jgi:proteasome lid subunit RPN8/RPN11